MMPCTVDDCDGSIYVKKLCRKHYEKLRTYGDPLVEIKIQGTGVNRILKRVELVPFTTCWIWMGSISAGYGALSVNKKTYLAHRYSYLVHKGDIPHGLHVMHQCHNRLCVNPDHLEVGTPLENERQKVAAGRQARGQGNGNSKLTDSQVGVIKNDKRMLKTISSQYGVSQSTISRIRSGMYWGHI